MIEEQRERLFVGRHSELGRLESLLEEESPRRLAYVHGMGGIGKTELLQTFGRRARRRGWQVVLVDARSLAESADAMRSALIPPDVPLDAPCLVLLDTFEHLSSVERALREHVLSSLPLAWRLAFAGRYALGPAWTAALGWSELLEIIELGELTHTEGRAYLERKGVAVERIEEVLEFAGGVPLALALAGEAVREADSVLDDDPDFVATMLDSLIERAPSPSHHHALVASAIVLRLTEDVLHVLFGESAPELFSWLASRPYFQSDSQGIYPHDLVRHALLRSVKWRCPQLFSELIIAAIEHYAACLARQVGTPQATGTAHDLEFLMAHTGMGPFVAEGHYRARVTEVGPDDWPSIATLAARQLGNEAVAHLERWRNHSAVELMAVRRSPEAQLDGFFAGVKVHELSVAEAREMPGVNRFFEHFAGPFDRPVPYVWLWTDQRSGHGLSQTQTCAMKWLSRQILAHPVTLHAAFAVRDGDDWLADQSETTPKPVPECAFELGPCSYVVWHVHYDCHPTVRYLDLIHEALERLRAEQSAAPIDRPSGGAILSAVKAALRQADRPERLADSELFRLAVVRDRASDAPSAQERGQRLVELLRELSTEIFSSARDEVYWEALRRTYFEPSGKQRAIAADLGLGYSTFRRYLATAIEGLADALMRAELAARSIVDWTPRAL